MKTHHDQEAVISVMGKEAPACGEKKKGDRHQNGKTLAYRRKERGTLPLVCQGRRGRQRRGQGNPVRPIFINLYKSGSKNTREKETPQELKRKKNRQVLSKRKKLIPPTVEEKCSHATESTIHQG